MKAPVYGNAYIKGSHILSALVRQVSLALVFTVIFCFVLSVTIFNFSYSQDYLSKLEESFGTLLNQSNQTDPLTNFGDISPDSQVLTYDNSVFGLQMQYPRDWFKTEYGSGSAEFLPPSVGNNTEKDVGLWVYILPNGPASFHLPLNELVTEVLKEHKKTFTDFQLIEQNSADTLGDSPAITLTFTYINSTIGIVKVMEVIANKGSLSFVIKYAATNSVFPKYLGQVEKMIDSAKLGDSKINI